MNILGLSLSPHDSSAAIVKDGVVVEAIEEEKLSRIRHCINYDNSKYNLESEADYFDTHFLHISQKQLKEKIGKLTTYLNENRKLKLLENLELVVGSNLMIGAQKPSDNYLNIGHHLAHAAHAFFTSPFKQAAVLVIDGAGDVDRENFETVSLYVGKGNDLRLLEKMTGKIAHDSNTIIALKNSLGVLYQNASVLCGFGTFGEGKLMGLSSYGQPKYENLLAKHYSLKETHCEVDNLGLYLLMKRMIEKNDSIENMADIAASVQAVLNKLVLFYVQRLKQITGQENLCYSGGVALNAITNSYLLRESAFKRIYIPSAPSDNGVSIGAALYGYHKIKGKPRKVSTTVSSVYLGHSYKTSLILSALRQRRAVINYEKLSEKDLVKSVASLLFSGKVIGWFQSGSEFGPRALGHRSILASPLDGKMRDRLNLIKGRESFRPVAPIIMQEHLKGSFRIPKNKRAESLPYMLFVFSPVNKNVANKIPAAIHTDNTARIQTVNKKENLTIHSLLKEFKWLAGVPILINTSFNIKGEPMVETPTEAIDTFLNSDIDYLVLENYLCSKK